MLLRLARTCFKKIGFSLALLIALIPLVYSLGRTLSPTIYGGKSLVEHLLSKNLHHPAHVESFIVQWSGLEPILVIKHVNILGTNNQESLLKINQFEFQVDLWNSLRHFKILPDRLKIDGAHVKILQKANKSWRVLGVGDEDSASQESLGDVKSFFYWLAMQTEISVDHLSADVEFFHGRKVSLADFGIQLKNDDGAREIVGIGQIKTHNDLHPFRLVVKPKEMSEGPNKFSASFYVNLPFMDFAPWFNPDMFSAKRFPIKSSIDSISAELWGEMQSGRLLEVRAKLKGDGVKLENVESTYKFEAQQFSTKAVWRRKPGGWRVFLNELNIKAKDVNNKIHTLVFGYEVSEAGTKYSMNLDTLSLANLKKYMHLSIFWDKQLENWNKQLAVKGEVSQVDFSYLDSVDNHDQFAASFDFTQVEIKPYQQIPGVHNLAGKIKLNQDSGTLVLNAHDAEIQYPVLFMYPFHFTALAMQFDWDFSHGGEKLYSIQKICLENDNLKAQGKLDFKLSPNKRQRLDLQGNFSAKNVGLLSKYVPLKQVSKELGDWLRHAFHHGEVQRGVVDIHGFLGEEKHPPKVNIKMDVSKLGLHYAPKWPDINSVDAVLEFNDQKMLVNANHVNIVSNQIQHVTAEIPNMASPILTVKIDSPVILQRGIDFLAHSPLEIGKALKNWQGEGEAKLELTLLNDLRDQVDESHVRGSILFSKNKIVLMPNLAPLTEVSGVLAIEDDMLSSNNISARMLGQPLQSSISTIKHKNAEPELKVKLQGSLEVDKLLAQSQWSLAKFVTGRTQFTGEISIEEIQDNLVGKGFIQSNLEGIKLGLPAPLFKTKDKKQLFLINLEFGEKDTFAINAELKDLLASKLVYRLSQGKPEFVSGNLHFGVGKAVWPKSQGLTIDGFLSTFDWDVWKPYVSPYLSSEASNLDALKILRDVQLEVRKVIFAEHEFGNTYFNLTQQKNDFVVGLESREVVGKVKIPKIASAPWKIDIKRLNLKLDQKEHHHSAFLNDYLDPRALPSLRFTCESCIFDGNPLGKIKLNIDKEKAGIEITDFDVDGTDYTFQAKGSWLNVGDHFVTDLYGSFTNYNLGRFLSAWGYSSVIAQGFGETMFSLNWTGSPFKVNWSNLTGRVAFRYSDGRITKLSHQTENKIGFGRLLNILSLQSLPQTVLTGFTNLGKKGFEFNSFKGDLSIANGVGRTNNVELEGPVAWVSVTGSIDFPKKHYDLMMHVTPNVTSSLPLIVGIAGGPVAGALTWMANKILAPKIGKVAKKDYHIKGSMGKLNVTVRS